MCYYSTEHWSCLCEDTVYLGPSDNPSDACRASAALANRTQYPYACPQCSKNNVRNQFGNSRLATSSGKKRSSDDFEEDYRSFAERVADKRFARPPGLDLNLSVAPKRSRTSRGNYSSDAPQFRDRKANTRGYEEPTFVSRIANPAQDLEYIDMPAEVPQVLPTNSIFERSTTSRRRPGSSGDGRSVRRIGSVMTHRPTRRSPMHPDSPVSPVTPPSDRRLPPKLAALTNVQLRQAACQPVYVPGPYAPSFHADFSTPQASPPTTAFRDDQARGVQIYQDVKDAIERNIATGEYSARQIKKWASFQSLSPQHQYELLESYRGCLPDDGGRRGVPKDRVRRTPVPQRAVLERKVGVIERFADWLWGRK